MNRHIVAHAAASHIERRSGKDSLENLRAAMKKAISTAATRTDCQRSGRERVAPKYKRKMRSPATAAAG